MRIEIGRYAGFCRGVKRAVDGAFACARQAPDGVVTDGELIHNPQTLEMLAHHNVRVLGGEDDLETARDRVVVIRAHGIPPDRLQRLKDLARSVENLTCRDVARVQGLVRRASRRGQAVVVFGKPNHPEVRGILGHARSGHVVGDPAEVEALPDLGRVLLVSQTTMSREGFEAVADAVQRRFAEVEVVNTICDATELRQREAERLARRNQRVLVIGGRTSSNTRRLVEVAGRLAPTDLVEDVDELQAINLAGVRSLGVTAGASTPDWLIDEVVDEVRRRTQPKLMRLAVNLAELSLYSNVFAALGASILSLAVADTVGVGFSPPIAALVSLYYLAMSLLNAYTSRTSMRIDNRRRYRFMHRYRALFATIFLASCAGVVLLAGGLGYQVTLLTLFAVVLGAAYDLSYLPTASRAERILVFRKADLLALKSIVISLAMTTLLNGLPLIRELDDSGGAAGPLVANLGFFFSLYYVFMVMFTRQALVEIRSAQSDRITGVSSLLNLTSRARVRRLLYALPTVLALVMLVGLVLGAYPASKAKYFVAIGYDVLLVLLSGNRRLFASRFSLEMLVESNLWVAGLIALLR